MAGPDQRKRRQGKKSEPGNRQPRRVPVPVPPSSSASSSFLPPTQPINAPQTVRPVPEPGPGPGPVSNVPHYGSQNSHVICNYSCCPPLTLQNLPNLPPNHHHHQHQHQHQHHHHHHPLTLASNTVHHFGVTQLLNSNRSLEYGQGGESLSQQHHNGRGNEQGKLQLVTGYEPGSRKLYTATTGAVSLLQQPPMNGCIFPEPRMGKFVGPSSGEAQSSHQIYSNHQAQQYQQHSAAQQVPHGYQTVSLSNLTGVEHIGSDSNKISLNYVLNGNAHQNTYPQLEFERRGSATQSRLVINGDGTSSPYPHGRTLSAPTLEPSSSIPEINITALPANPNHSSSSLSSCNQGYLGHIRTVVSSASVNGNDCLIQHTNIEAVSSISGSTSSPQFLRRPSLYPCGPEVLHSIQQQQNSIRKEITCEPLQLNSVDSPSGFPNHLTVIVTQPEVTITRAHKPIHDPNVDLSKLNYLSHLACEVGKLELGATRQQRVEEILTRNPNLRTPVPEENLQLEQDSLGERQSGSPVIFLAAVHGKQDLVPFGEQMGVFHTMTNGSGESSGVGGDPGIKIKQEAIDLQQHEETIDQVLDLRKPSSEKLCIWCGKNSTLVENGIESDFCTELCFHMYRRDSFKKRSNCIWCSGTSPGKHSGGVVDESRFCSEECLNNFKVKLFCEETSAHLEQLKEFELKATVSAPIVNNNYEMPQEKGAGVPSRGSSSLPRPSPSGNELITPDLWLKKQSASDSKKGSSGGDDSSSTSPPKTSPRLIIRSASGTPSPSADSLHSANFYSNSNSLSPTQHNIYQPQPSPHGHDLTTSSQIPKQRVPPKGRLYPAFTGNSVSNHGGGGRRRASSPISMERDRDRWMPCGPRSSRDYGSQPSPRKRVKSNATGTTNTATTTLNNFHRMDQISHLQHQQQALGSLPMNISMLQMGAAFAAMQGVNFNSVGAPVPCLPLNATGGNNHQGHKPSRKNMMSSGGQMNNNPNLCSGEMNPNGEIVKALMMNGPAQRHQLHNSGPRTSSMIMQQQGHGTGTAAMITHSGLHTGGLMMTSPTAKQSYCSSNSSISKLPLSLGLSLASVIGIAPPQPPVASSLENRDNKSIKPVTTAGNTSTSHGAIRTTDQNGGGLVECLSNNSTVSVNGISPPVYGTGVNEILNMSLGEQREGQAMASTSSPPVSTCTSCTQTDSDEKQGNSQVKVGNLGGNELPSHPFSILPPVTLLVPYPIPIPFPVPMPFFFPNGIHPSSTGPEQQAEPNNNGDEHAGNDDNKSDGQCDEPEPPNQEKIIHEQNAIQADLHEKEIQDTIEISLQDVAYEIEIAHSPEDMEHDEESGVGIMHAYGEAQKLGLEGESENSVGVDEAMEKREIFQEGEKEINCKGNEEEDMEGVMGDESEELIMIEMLDDGNENSQNSPINFNNDTENVHSVIEDPPTPSAPEVEQLDGENVVVIKREPSSPQKLMDD